MSESNKLKPPMCLHEHVEFNAESDNYYCKDCHGGMGLAYYKVAKQLDRHAGLVSQYVSDEQTYGTHRELYDRVSELADVLKQAETCIFYCVKGNDNEGQRVFELIGKTLKAEIGNPDNAPSLRSQIDALKADVAELAKDKARVDWFIRYLQLDERDCGCPPIASVSMKLVADAGFNDHLHLLRDEIDIAMETGKH